MLRAVLICEGTFSAHEPSNETAAASQIPYPVQPPLLFTIAIRLDRRAFLIEPYGIDDLSGFGNWNCSWNLEIHVTRFMMLMLWLMCITFYYSKLLTLNLCFELECTEPVTLDDIRGCLENLLLSSQDL